MIDRLDIAQNTFVQWFSVTDAIAAQVNAMIAGTATVTFANATITNLSSSNVDGVVKASTTANGVVKLASTVNTNSATLVVTASQALYTQNVAQSAAAFANTVNVYAYGAFAHSNTTLSYAQAGYANGNNTLAYAQAGFSFANGVNTYAFGAFAKANSAFSNDTATNIKAQASFDFANTVNVYAYGAFAHSNTTLAYTQSAFDKANTSWNPATNTTANLQIVSLGVGTTPSGTAGEIRATNEITAYYSDRRLKDIIGTIENALEKIGQLSGVVYTPNQIAVSYGYEDTKEQVGVIAQEVEKVLPQAIRPAPFDSYMEGGKTKSISGEYYKTVLYERLIPLIIEAIKELDARTKHVQR